MVSDNNMINETGLGSLETARFGFNYMIIYWSTEGRILKVTYTPTATISWMFTGLRWQLLAIFVGRWSIWATGSRYLFVERNGNQMCCAFSWPKIAQLSPTSFLPKEISAAWCPTSPMINTCVTPPLQVYHYSWDSSPRDSGSRDDLYGIATFQNFHNIPR